MERVEVFSERAEVGFVGPVVGVVEVEEEGNVLEILEAREIICLRVSSCGEHGMGKTWGTLEEVHC